jgi:hypothetical protein
MIDDLNPRRVFIRRLGYYALGLAIGLMALGFIQMGRSQQLAKQAEEEKARLAEIEARAKAEAKQRGLPSPDAK